MSAAQGDPWDSLWDEFEDFRHNLAKSTAHNVNTDRLRTAAKAIVQRYFRQVRPELARLGLQAEEMSELDTLMQQLLRLANGQNSKRTYTLVLLAIRRIRPQLDIHREMLLGTSATPSPIPRVQPAAVEGRILATLQQLLPTAASSYQQAVLDLQAQGRISYRGAAVELREALREVLDHFAPDEAVMKWPGFTLEKGATKPTMRQKTKFILKSRGGTANTLTSAQDTVTLIEEVTASLARSVYQRASISTHISSTQGEVRRLKLYSDAILAELLEIG